MIGHTLFWTVEDIPVNQLKFKSTCQTSFLMSILISNVSYLQKYKRFFDKIQNKQLNNEL